ncbi:phosphomannomutase/phosphoglucomutase [Desulfonatronum thioautotrophicum]|uniref:phosphomannomutase/phosphoglucomutase n=1 Tax=Desulfonatronum thioautotrophicum TaxID=617001 RepID=UPI0005EB8345|nr:phosphomannomutase/phosphoglucomutase [Desulfonatronum thioautotrophicum]
MRIKQEIFRAYDIRGIVDHDFNEEWVEILGKACGTFFLQRGQRQAVVGHDCRHSSPGYQKAMIKGLLSAGVDVLFINMVPTPLFYYAVKKFNRQAGVMITASHNPPEFNGFKVWSGAGTIHSSDVQELYAIMTQGKFSVGQGIATEHDVVPAYLEELSAQVHLPTPIRVVVDGGNGAGGLICAEVLRRIGADVVELYCEPDGNFPNHHPDPTREENNVDLRTKVLETGAHVGIGLDGDADRIGSLDETGRMIYGDRLLAIFARQVLQGRPGGTVIGEVKCSHLMFQDIADHGGKPIMGQTGHSLIKAKMQETGAVLAGEMSGHMFFADRYYGFDDALYAALRLTEIIGQRPDKPLSTYLSEWPPIFSTPEIRMDCPEEIKFAVVERAQAYFRDRYDVVDVDGVRIVLPDGWGLLRASNTQPILVLRFEAESESRLQEIRALVEDPLKQWIAELEK